jgi:phosphatidylglycerophosphate synthase
MPASGAAPAGTAPGGADNFSLEDLARIELARAEREAEDAQKSGAFKLGVETTRLRREDLADEAGPGATPEGAEPLLGAGAGSPLLGDAKPGEAKAKELAADTESPTPSDPVPVGVPAPAAPVAETPAPAAPVAETTAAAAPVAETPVAAAPVAAEAPAPAAAAPAAAQAPAAAAETPLAPVPAAEAPKTDAAPAAEPAPKKPRTGSISSARLPKVAKPEEKRSEEDDRLVAAVIFLDVPNTDGFHGPPSPLATVGGVSLIKRAAASVKLAGVERVFLAGQLDANLTEKVREEFKAAGNTGTLETWDGKGTAPFGERGRILILDAAGVHDPPAVARLARFKGERAYVLIASEGDGVRVQVEGNKVREVGAQLVPFDGVTCGAMNAPIPLFARLSELGAMGALISLAADGLLGAQLERRTFAREIGSETGLSEARQRLFDRAVGSAHDTVINRLLHRRISRPLTSMLNPMGIPVTVVSIVALIVGLAGAALFTGLGAPPSPWILLAGTALLIVSAIFDCVDDELASLSIQRSQAWRFVDVLSDGIVTTAAFAGLGYGAQQLGVPSGLLNGAIAAAGAAIATVLVLGAKISWDDGPEASDSASLGVELLARRLLNREIAYVILLIVVAYTVSTFVHPGGTEIIEYSLVGLAALAHSYWVALGICLLARPRRS